VCFCNFWCQPGKLHTVAESSFWSHFLEASFDDMLPTAKVDARTMKFYFRELFLVVPFFCKSRNFCEDSDKMAVPTQNGSLTRDIPRIGMLVGLLLLFC
jgi:hypothetical protein